MATQPLVPQRTGQNTPEAFIADRQVFWTWFTRAIMLAVAVLAAVVILVVFIIA